MSAAHFELAHFDALPHNVGMESKDLACGSKFGRLTIVAKQGRLGTNTAYLCKCDCDGVEKLIRGSDIVSGRTRSCGCLGREHIAVVGRSKKLQIAIGTKFERLTVLEEQGRLGTSVAYLCKCDCGTEKRIAASYLVSGNTRSCGCLQRNTAYEMGKSNRSTIVPGTRFGKLTVILDNGIRGKSATYLCRCECGNETIVTASALTSGNTRSCSCLRLESIKKVRYERRRVYSSGTKFGKLQVVEEIGKMGRSIAYLCRCECGNDKQARVGDLVSGKTKSCGCLRSQPEMDLLQFIRDRLPGLKVIHNDRSVLGPFELDIWVPDRGLAIEFNGVHWHGERIDPEKKWNSYRKYQSCRDFGIRLVTIFEDEWQFRRPIVEGYILSILGQKRTMGARKCAVDKTDASVFFEANHLQGSVRGSHYRLSLDGTVVAAAAFSKATKSKAMGGAGVWELTRYAALPDLSVPGGASRLLHAFLRDTPECRSVISYSDNRWSAGGMYEAMGFKCTVESKPSYSYFQGIDRVHRFNWRKSEALRVYGGSPEETEWEIMQRNGWDRIWDCGKKRWELGVLGNQAPAARKAA